MLSLSPPLIFPRKNVILLEILSEFHHWGKIFGKRETLSMVPGTENNRPKLLWALTGWQFNRVCSAAVSSGQCFEYNVHVGQEPQDLYFHLFFYQI